ncbi:hypothetical protein TRICI_002935 [Trichomonascus ciferrii]|uniref:Uncharacterized protein n=1 Tax=Trichomonascus ciferrii TaxID=44093 RepID=A0A642V4H8_9ASCO|nr:hypothetical protein TRICI_002935 [Trichomonascus ciferrii]
MTADGPTTIAPQKGDIAETLQQFRKRLESDGPHRAEVGKSQRSDTAFGESPSEASGYDYRRRETSESPIIGFTPIYPLILALMPAGMSLLIGDSAGIFIADALLLFAIGWVIWSVTEGSWALYYNRLNVAAANEPTPGADSITIQDFNLLTSLLFYLASPFIGGWILYFSRQNLSGGSKLITNFNIFLYISLELGRCINRITKYNSRNPINPALGLENINKRLSSLELELRRIQESLNSVVNKVSYNETAFNNELYTIWKGVDRVNRGLKTVSSIKPETKPSSPDHSLHRLKRDKKASPQFHIKTNQLPTVDEFHETTIDPPQPPTISKLKDKINDRTNANKLVSSSENRKQASGNGNSSTRRILSFVLNFSIYALLLLPFRIVARFSGRSSARSPS